MLTKIILASRDLDQLIFVIFKYEAKNPFQLSIKQSADCLPDIWAKKRLEDTKTSFFDPKISENAEIKHFPHQIKNGDLFILEVDHVPDVTSYRWDGTLSYAKFYSEVKLGHFSKKSQKHAFEHQKDFWLFFRCDFRIQHLSITPKAMA